MILCVGVTGSGKTMLLRQLQERGQNLLNSAAKPETPPTAKAAAAAAAAADVIKPPLKISTAQTSVPTIGTDLITLSR